jgi:hypothetical protein
MNLLVAASAFLALIALLLLGSTVRHTRRGRPLRATSAFAGCAVSAALGGAGLMLFISYAGYEQLTDEQLVGVIEFSRSAPDEFTARLMVDGQLDRLLPLNGDEWQLDARIITWKPPATILGMNPVFQLERLSGRYSDIDRERSEARTVHSLAEERPLDLWSLARKFPDFAPGIDAYYGTATYVPMADGARFRITMSRDALVARPINDAARESVGSWGQDTL